MLDHRTTKCDRRREDVVLTIQHSLIRGISFGMDDDTRP